MLYNYITQEWYTPAEVAVHNTASDCWVSLNGKVYDLTSWLQEQFRICKCTKNCSCPVKNWYCGDDCVEYCNCFKRGYFYCDAKRIDRRSDKDRGRSMDVTRSIILEVKCRAVFNSVHSLAELTNEALVKRQLAMTILAYAGKDVSHWFNGDEWVRYIHPVTGTNTTYMPHGHGHQQPVVPSTRWRPYQNPWWMNDKYVVGKATAKTRPIRITNTLTGSTVTLEVCSEETIYQIMMRYLPHNTHMLSYTWRYLGRGICYNRTLAENGIPDERDRFSDVLLPENIHIPALLLYYNDDLTEDPSRDDCSCGDFSCLVHRDQKCHQ